MEKIVWIMEEERKDMLDIQRKINALGGMRAMCILSVAALQKNIQERLTQNRSLSNPSLILLAYNIIRKNSEILKTLKVHPKLAGVPLFFIIAEEENILEEYYLQGAMVVLKRPISQSSLLRIKRAAEQYEATKNYERIFQKQVSELEAAKKIQELNIQLESRNKFLYRVFGKYFSDELLEVILDTPEGEFIGGDRRNIAVFLADLRGFSSKSEKMSSEEITDLLNCFFGTMLEIITQYNGTVIEFLGDAILAVFGAPMKYEKYAEYAIAAAICMQNAMKEVNEFCRKRNSPELEMGIGIHCGQAFVGNIGSEKMMRYNVIGRVVNECSRIESCSVGGQVFVSEETLKAVSCEVDIINRTQITAKGIHKPIPICEINGIGGTYQCYLETQKNMDWYSLQKEIFFELFPIHNKIIDNRAIIAQLTQLSTYGAIVEVLENAKEINQNIALLHDITLFSDVEIKSIENGSISMFSDVYAKIVQIEGKKLQLRFTHRNQDFEKFIMDIKRL